MTTNVVDNVSYCKLVAADDEERVDALQVSEGCVSDARLVALSHVERVDAL